MHFHQVATIVIVLHIILMIQMGLRPSRIRLDCGKNIYLKSTMVSSIINHQGNISIGPRLQGDNFVLRPHGEYVMNEGTYFGNYPKSVEHV